MRTLPAGHNRISVRARHGASADRLGLRQIPGFAAVVTSFLPDGGEDVHGT